MDKAQISRWKRDWVPKISMLLAVLEYGVVDEDMARQGASILTKKKPSTAETVEGSQITIEFN